MTQVARPCSHDVWMVDVSALGNRKDLEIEQWRGLHVFRRPGSPQMAGPGLREELDVRSVLACHASTNHGVARNFTVVGWSKPSRHARPESAPSRPRQHHLGESVTSMTFRTTLFRKFDRFHVVSRFWVSRM